jgi:formylmethanofuran dehydrogenase subunit A
MIVLRGGKIIDPAQGWNGEVRDLWLEGERVIAPPDEPVEAQEIDARGWWIAPGAIEIHSHISGAGLALARGITLTENGDWHGLMLTARQIADAYLRMGFTMVMDAAVSPLLAWRSQVDLAEMNGLDRGALTLVGDQQLVLHALRRGNEEEIQQSLSWLLRTSGGYGLKLVNAGVGSTWRQRRCLTGLDEPIGPAGISQRQRIVRLALAAQQMGLPHPVHVHANQLGQPGGWRNFCETARAFEGLPGHLCHIQYYCYDQDERGRLRSAVAPVVETLAPLKKLSFDVGQIVFGRALAVSCDLQLIEWLQKMERGRWVCRTLEGEGGVGSLPLEYRPGDPASAVQWAVGLELLLRFPDPLRLFLTSDYPNGGPFTAYPQILTWLMDREERMRAIHQVHPAAVENTGLAGLEREYSLFEVVQMTSSGPAQRLGLSDRGSLEVGRLADLRCYRQQEDLRTMFAEPELVIKRGQVVARCGERTSARVGKTLVVCPEVEPASRKTFEARTQERTTLRPQEYAVDESEFPGQFEEVACRSAG